MITKIFRWFHLPYREEPLFGTVLITLFVVPLFFLPVIEDMFEGPRFVVSMLMVGICLIVFYFRQAVEWRFSKKLFWAIIGFLVLNFISAIFGLDFYNSIFGIYGRYATSLVFLTLWVCLIFLIGTQNSRNKTLFLMKMFLISGTLVAVLGILHSYEILFYFGINNTDRAIIPSFIGNQNFAAIYLIGIIPFLLPVLKHSKRIISATVYGLFGALMIWALMIFASRGAILSFGIGIIIGLTALFIKKIEWKYRVLAIAIICLGVVFAFFFYSTTRLQETAGSLDISKNVSAQTRIIVWAESTNLILHNPILGLGLGNFYIGFRGLGNISLPGTERFDDAHNLYLHTAASSGVPAMVVLLVIVILPLYHSIKEYYTSSSLISWAITVGLISLLVSFCFSPVDISNWFLLAFLIAISQSSVSAKFVLVDDYYKGLKFSTLVIGLFLIVISCLFMTSEIYTKNAKLAYRGGNFEKAHFFGKIAVLTNPINGMARLYLTASMIKMDFDAHEIRSEIKKITNLHPRSSGNQKYSGDLYFMLYKETKDVNDLQASFSHVEKERELEPNFPPVLINEAYLYYKAGSGEKAKQLLNQAVSSPAQGEYYFGWLLLAQLYLDEKKYLLVIDALKKANSISPSLILDDLIQGYERGDYQLDKLPIYFPDVDV